MLSFRPCSRRRRSLLQVALGLAATIVAAPTEAHELRELVVSSPYPHGDFGMSVDVDDDYAAIGAPGYGGFVYLMERHGGSWRQRTKIRATDIDQGARFGSDVSRFGEWLAVGAPGDDEQGYLAGSVYLYRQNPDHLSSFVFFQKLTSDAPFDGARFGSALDGSLNYLTVGEPGIGAAEVFTFDGTTWNSAQRLFAPPGGMTFGTSVAMDGRRIAIGDPNYNDADPGRGAVSVYDWDPTPQRWVSSHLLKSSYADDLGASVAMSAGALIAGSPRTEVGGVERGSAVLFAVSPSTASERGVSYGTGANDDFGRSVDIGYAPDATFRAVVGIPFAGGVNQGSVRVLTYDHSVGWIPTATLAGDGTSSSAWLGFAVCLDGDEVLAGTPRDRHEVGRGGTVRHFDISSGAWIEKDTLSPRVLDAGDWFGSDVAVAGDVAVVGASRDGEMLQGAGAAYVFERQADDSWRHTSSLFPTSDVTPGAAFGEAVVTDGERILVAAPSQDDYSGRAYIFDQVGNGEWELVAHLVPSLGLNNGFFGTSIAIDGDMAVVGAVQEDGASSRSGAVYVYTRSSSGVWQESQRLTVPGTTSSSDVGMAVGLDFEDGELLVGMSGERAVARFTWSGSEWQPALPILPGAGEPDTLFGSSISVRDGHLAIGTSNLSSRTVHLYRKVAGSWGFREAVSDLGSTPSVAYDGRALVAGNNDTPVILQRFDQLWQNDPLVPTGLDDHDYAAVDLSDSIAIQGSREANFGPLSGTGRAWIVEIKGPGPFLPYGFGDGSGNPCPCGNESAVGANEGCVNTSGRGAKLRAEGTSSVIGDDLVIVAEGLPNGRNGQLFVGIGRLFGAPFGDGQRLVASPSKRLAIRTANAGGEARYPIQHSIGFWNPGDTRYFQVLYRDFGSGVCGNSFNTSSGLAVFFLP